MTVVCWFWGDARYLPKLLITWCLCHSFLFRGKLHTLSLVQRGNPPTFDSPPQTSPMQIFPTVCRSSGTAPVWVPSMRCILQEQTGPVWVPCRVTSPAANLLQPGFLSPYGHKSCQEPDPTEASHRVAACFEHPPAPYGAHVGAGWHWLCWT